MLLTVFPQPPLDHQEENNNSIGIRLEYGKFSVLMTGDSETDERQWWLAHNSSLIRDCTILKLAHHGSRNGTDQRWLDLVQPEAAVASLAGKRLRTPSLRDDLSAPKERDPFPAHRPARHHHHRQQRPHLEYCQLRARPPWRLAEG